MRSNSLSGRPDVYRPSNALILQWPAIALAVISVASWLQVGQIGTKVAFLVSTSFALAISLRLFLVFSQKSLPRLAALTIAVLNLTLQSSWIPDSKNVAIAGGLALIYVLFSHRALMPALSEKERVKGAAAFDLGPSQTSASAKSTKDKRDTIIFARHFLGALAGAGCVALNIQWFRDPWPPVITCVAAIFVCSNGPTINSSDKALRIFLVASMIALFIAAMYSRHLVVPAFAFVVALGFIATAYCEKSTVTN